MGYRFHPGSPLAQEVLRIGDEQLKLAIRLVAVGREIHTEIHQTRKAIKRVRALLRLVKPALGQGCFAHEDKRYRGIAKRLAGAREIQAKIECIALLEERFGAMGDNSVVGLLRSELIENRQALEQKIAGVGQNGTQKALREARARFKNLQLKGHGFGVVRAGLAKSYRAGGTHLQSAFGDGTAEAFHEWRKWVQQHWRHMQLLSHAWPQEMTARIGATRELSEILGHDHDIAMIGLLLRTDGKRFGDEKSLKALKKLLGKRQQELRALARPRGERLFFEKPTEFATRIENYWQQAIRLSATDQGDWGDQKAKGDTARHAKAPSDPRPK